MKEEGWRRKINSFNCVSEQLFILFVGKEGITVLERMILN
jgi:hypothetical protein